MVRACYPLLIVSLVEAIPSKLLAKEREIDVSEA